jgi:cold shock CspA family protein
MIGIVNWYSDRKKQGLIEGKNGEAIMVYEKDLAFLTILHAGDSVEYSIAKTIKGKKAVSLRQINKKD